MTIELSNNTVVNMFKAAESDGSGMPGVVCYNLEAVIACRKAAENTKSPCQILLFPWSQDYGRDHLAKPAADVCRFSSVPMSLHLDHAQSADAIYRAAKAGKFNSIMINMSHYEKEENLSRTAELVRFCHERGISTEAEPERINAGEAGVQDTGDLDEILTSPEEAGQFIAIGIGFLAPAIGNVYGPYHGVENIRLDFPRLEKICRVCQEKRVALVMHGTNEFNAEIFQQCVAAGMTRLNVDQVAICDYEVVCVL